MKIDWKKFLISLAIPFVTAFFIYILFAFGTINSDTFEAMKKPIFFPTEKTFCRLWVVVCALLGLAAFRVWTSVTTYENLKNAVAVYFIQLFLCFVWAFVFFVMKEYFFAFSWFIAVIAFILFTKQRFAKIDKLSGYLILPQMLMALFTGYLNLGIVLLN